MQAQGDDLFFLALENSVGGGNFVKLSLGNYQGSDTGLKQILVKPVHIKREDKLAFTYRYKTKDLFKNFPVNEGLSLVKAALVANFNIATLFTTQEEFILERMPKGAFRLRSKSLAEQKSVNTNHNHQKQRLITAAGNFYLHKLGLADTQGKVFDKSQDKFKQINHYIEIINSLVSELPHNSIRQVVDMGSGKGYLTFALYDFLRRANTHVAVKGVEYRQDLVDFCNNLAAAAEFKGLFFVQGTIESFEMANVDLLIALHACDTATDDAIYKGIQSQAKFIMVAPCCHKQIRREIEKSKPVNEVSFLTKHGIFLERHAEMLTDGMRALILEYFGYKTKIFEFISDVHTPKNVMLVGIKGKHKTDAQLAEIMHQLKSAKSNFGISQHYLEKLLQL